MIKLSVYSPPSQLYLNLEAGNFCIQLFASEEASNLTTGEGSSVYWWGEKKHSWVLWKFLWAHQEISDVQQEMSDVSSRSIYWNPDVPRRKWWAAQFQEVNQSNATPTTPPDGCSQHTSLHHFTTVVFICVWENIIHIIPSSSLLSAAIWVTASSFIFIYKTLVVMFTEDRKGAFWTLSVIMEVKHWAFV